MGDAIKHEDASALSTEPTGGRTKLWRVFRVLLIGIALVVVLAFAVFVLPEHAPQPVTFTLSDGTVVEVLKVTSGPVHRFRYDNRWQDIVGEHLPKAWRQKLKARVMEYVSPRAGSLVVWTKSRGGSPIPQFEIAVPNEYGVEVGMDRFPVSMSQLSGLPGTTPSASTFAMGAGWNITPLPGHTRDVTLRFYDGLKRVAEFKLPNPAYRKEDTLRPEPLPQVKSSDDVQVKLVGVAAAGGRRSEWRVDWTITAELTRGGQVLPDWIIDAVEAYDDEGLARSSQTSRRSFFNSRTQLTTYELFDGLWPHQSWKLRLWIAQTNNFATNEIWTLNNVAVPTTAQVVAINEQREFGSHKVELIGLSGPQATSFSMGSVMVQFSAPKTEDLRITFLRGHDDQGRKLDRANPGWGSQATTPGGKSHYFGLNLAPDAQTLTLEFAVHRARSVDFIVKPTMRP